MMTLRGNWQVKRERKTSVPNKRTRNALAEYDRMKKHPEEYKRYSSFAEMREDINLQA